jgi:multidrug efflux system outer membrane protein
MTFSLKICCCSILLITGCTGIPSHPPLRIVPPHATRSGVPIVHDSHDFSRLRWWRRMHSPELNHLIETALAKNPQIQAANANVLQAQAKLNAARFAWLPTLGLAGNGFVGGGWDTQITPHGALAQSPSIANMGNIHFRGYFNGFVPNYSLNLLQNIHSEQIAKASLNIQQATYQSTRLSIISQMSGAYFMLLGHVKHRQLQSELITDLKKNRALERVRYHDGASDLTTLAGIDQQIEDNQAQMASIEVSISEVENAMQTLLNQNPGPILHRQDINQLNVQGMIPARLPSSVLLNRPDVMIACENMKLNRANIGLAYAAFFPTISLTGQLGGASVALSHLLSLSTNLWIAQAKGTISVLNGEAYAKIQAAKASSNAAFWDYEHTLKSVFEEVDNSLTRQQKMNEAYRHQLQAHRAAKRAYTLALSRYQNGAKDYREVMTAKLNLDYASINLNTAKMQQLDSLVEVYQALAGGYSAEG